MIKRSKYLQELLNYRDKKLIKVIVGVRKCGKSTLMLQYVEILKKDSDSNIIFVDLNDYQTSKNINDLDKLNNYIKKHYKPTKKNYLFVDEVQEIKDFQIIINSWINKKNMDIYITGSNSKLLSGEISTLITGKNIVITVYPLVFSELCHKNEPNIKTKFDKYFKYGGMPGRLMFENEKEIYTYLNMIYSDILQNDILTRNNVLDVSELTNIYKFIFDNLGKELSYKNIYNVIRKNGSALSRTTIIKYVELLRQCFLIQKINKFDLKGLKILDNLCKYYPIDIGMKNAIFKNFAHNRGKLLENIVLNELKYRGYEVFIGTSRTINEIDFVAKNNEETLYLQVTEYLTDENVEREIDPFLKIRDSNPKILLSLNELESKDRNGIQYLNLIKWLLK
ncbi:MAG: ATP-binding protein [Mycoplasmataceae bacterium]|nr:ATP-binding protein [Mycoplasmataceae bacterium]